ncbi:hypothetical protein JYU34_006341 [Plutella xylostella]|uniref:Peptidase S1 domain-containing protein n=1 Tax=Plutella xylostella TaxID=51655 RepID=A0ABQ7QRW5_PLUXY|nr:hypothetical protein JYU34_006341 [Plutella xylostella]
MKSEVCTLVLALCVVLVNPMSLLGPSFTRYDPCGLGLIQFDKTLTEHLWTGVLNFGLYPDLNEVVVTIEFKDVIRFAWTPDKSEIFFRGNAKNLIIKPFGVPPKRYIFYVLLLAQSEVPVVTSFKLNNQTLCSEEEKAAQTTDSFNLTKEHSSYQHVCGRRSMDHTELVTTGADAQNGDWPWHVAMFIVDAVDKKKEVYQCGGSIISWTTVLTAGHCVSSKGSITEAHRVLLVAGTANLSDSSAPGLKRFYAKKVILHPSYTDDLPTADLAILKVDKLTFTKYIQPICLWTPNYPYDKSLLFGKDATILGFGLTEKDVFSKTLRTSNTVVQTDAACIAYAPDLYPRLLNEFSFCVGYGPKYGQKDVFSKTLRTSNTVVQTDAACIAYAPDLYPRLLNEFSFCVGYGPKPKDVFSKTLRTSNTVVQTDAACIAYAPDLYPRLLNEFSFCVGYGPKYVINPRNGDSGSGLLLPVQQADHKIAWFLRGVLSKCGMKTGAARCDPAYYVVYSDVAPHYTWIAHHAGLKYHA